MVNETLKKSYELGRNAAIEIKISPIQTSHIEARGFLCHELLFLLGGHIEFIQTSWRQFALKFLEYLFPILPICRWYPPENSVLEWIGIHESTFRVYRLIPTEPPITIFFVNYAPETPMVRHIRPLFKVPQLAISYFLQPPFVGSPTTMDIEQKLRVGSVQIFTPIPLTPEARKEHNESINEVDRGLWEEFVK